MLGGWQAGMHTHTHAHFELSQPEVVVSLFIGFKNDRHELVFDRSGFHFNLYTPISPESSGSKALTPCPGPTKTHTIFSPSFSQVISKP